MAQKGRGQLPAASWFERAANAVRARWDLEIEALPDTKDALLAWFAAELEPERVAIDDVDAALARWLGGLTAITRRTYQQNLRSFAAALGMSGQRPVRTLIDIAIATPGSLDAALGRFARETTWKTGTIRSRFSALRNASEALVAANLAPAVVATYRPKDTDVELRAADAEQVATLDAALRRIEGPIAARTRAAIQLAWSAALSAKELLTLPHQNVHLAGFCLVRGRERLRLSPDAVDAVRVWFEHRGRTDGPFLLSYDGRSGRRTPMAISSRGLQRAIARAARDAGVVVTLGSLRNGAMLRALDNDDREGAMKLSRGTTRFVVNRLVRERRRRAERRTG